MQAVGAFGEVKTDAEGLAKIAAWKSHVEGHTGAAYATFEPVHYTQQVVAGMNYKAKIHVGGGSHIHVKFYEPLPHTGDPVQISEHSDGHSLADAL